ncbi:MAG: hypothetical protein K6G00_05240 [Treponema sp.]|nr:hypothetical protein [Treponema sp.]
MKKFVLLFFILSITVGLAIAADTNTYTFGTVKISQDNELPSGYFTKAKNYLPGDSISISNPQNGAEVNVLNLGTLDESEDIAILISPEVASKLGIDFSVQLRIKLSPRPDNFDEIAAGSGILSYGESVYGEEEVIDEIPEADDEKSDDDFVIEESVADSVPESESYDTDDNEYAYASEGDDAEETEYIAENVVDSDSDDDAKEEIEEDVRIEPVADLSALYEKPIVENTVPVKNSLVSDAEKEIAAETAVEPETSASDIEESYVEPEISESDAAEVPALAYEEEPVAVVPEPVEQKLELIEDDFEPVSEEVTEYFVTETEPVVPEENLNKAPLEKIASNDIEEIEFEEEIKQPSVNEKKPENKLSAAEKYIDEPISDAEPFNFTDSIETDSIKNEPEVSIITEENDDQEEEVVEEDPYVPEIEEIVETTSVFSLTPTEAVVPVYDPKYARKSQPKEKQKSTPKKENKKTKVEESKPKAVQKAPAKAEAKSNVDTKKENVIIKDKNLRNGKYYIQIATVTTYESGMKVVNKYNKYPIVLVPFEVREGYKVMVGPLTTDEYGAVFEKFKSFGYKDAFVRKIK